MFTTKIDATAATTTTTAKKLLWKNDLTQTQSLYKQNFRKIMMHHDNNYCDNLIACAQTHKYTDTETHELILLNYKVRRRNGMRTIDGVQAFIATAKIILIFTQCGKRELKNRAGLTHTC